MKNRLLSLLLTVCLIAVSIPVSVSAVSLTSPSSSVYTMNEYDRFYVQNGLVGLYTAYAVENGKETSLVTRDGRIIGWADKVGGRTAAVLGDFAPLSAVGGGLGIAFTDSAWSNASLNSGIDFDDAYGNLAEMTVESILIYDRLTSPSADTRHAMSYTLFRLDIYTGMWVHAQNGTTVRPYLSNDNWGAFHGRTSEGERHMVNGEFQKPDGTLPGGGYVGNGFALKTGAVYNQTVTKTVDTLADTVSLKLTLNGQTMSFGTTYGESGKTEKVTLTTEGTLSRTHYDAIKSKKTGNKAGAFSMLNGVPGRMYAFRVYDRPLTADEAARNYAVDLCAYFKLDISAFDPLDGLPSAVVEAFSSYTFEGASKEALQPILDANVPTAEATPTSYLDLYIKDGLVALFDAFSADSIKLTQGKWLAYTPTANGTLKQNTALYGTITGGRYSAIYTPTGWRTYEEGGLGYSDPKNLADNRLSLPSSLLSSSIWETEAVFRTELRDFAASDEVVTSFTTEETKGGVRYTAVCSRNWKASVSVTVTFRNTASEAVTFTPTLSCCSDPANEEPTVISTYRPVSLKAGESQTVTFTGFTSKALLIEVPKTVSVLSVSFPATNSVVEARADEAFVFGNLYAMVWSNLQGSNVWHNGFGALRLHIGTGHWGSHEGNYSTDRLHIWTNGSATDFATYDGKLSHLLVQKTTNPDLSVTYRMRHNSASYSLSSDPEKGLATSAFILAGDLPMTLDSLRVYDRTLTETERKRNHTADLLAFTKTDISHYLALSHTDRLLFDDAVAEFSFSKDAAALSAAVSDTLLLLTESSATAYAESLIAFSTVEPLRETAGYRALFSVDSLSANMLESLGYRLYYGALVGAGAVDTHMTVRYEDGKLIPSNARLLSVFGGDTATGTFYRTSEREKIYSAAVLYDDPTMYEQATSVRGFALLVSPSGNVTVAYDSISTPERAHNICDLADYYVNRFEGSYTEMTAHIQNESLQAVLAACQRPARQEAVGDTILHIFVNPTGSDNGRGTESQPYATLARAHDRMLEAYGAGVLSVIIHLSDGIHRVTEEWILDGASLDPRCELFLVGEGRDTVVTSTVPIGKAENGTVSIAKGNGEYPNFRYLYAADEEGGLTPVRLTHTGHREDVRYIETLPFTDAEAETVYVFLDADLFDGVSSYAGTELHMITEWDFNVLQIERVDYGRTHPGGTQTRPHKDGTPTEVEGGAVPDGKVMVYLNYHQYNQIAIPANHTLLDKAYWLENSREVFEDARADEDVYYYDKETGTVYIRDVASDSTVTADTSFEIPTLERIFHFTNTHNVTLQGFSITGTNNLTLDGTRSYVGGQAGGCSVVDRETGEKTSLGFHTVSAVFGENVQGFRAKDMLFFGLAGDGIYLRGSVEGLTVENCEFSHLGQSGLRVGNSGGWSNANHNRDLLIQNNYIHHTGELFVQCCGMLVTSAYEARIVGNTVTNTTYTGISIGWRWNEATWRLEEIGENGKTNLYHVEIAYNYIADFMTCMRDGGGIYTLGGNVENDEHTFLNSLHDNYMVITEETGKYKGTGRWFMGYYHDGASSNWYDYNNVIINATTTGVGSLVPLYVQHINGQNAHNVTLHKNYAIGFTGASQVYANHIDPARYIYADDYLFTGVDVMSAAERAAAGAICATAGSSLAPTGDTGHADIRGIAQERLPIFGDNKVALSDLDLSIAILAGDANGDGAVDGKDVIALRQYLVGNGTVSLGADANGDGTVDGKDVILLRRYLVGAEALPLFDKDGKPLA